MYQFWCFYQKVHNSLDILDYAAALIDIAPKLKVSILTILTLQIVYITILCISSMLYSFSWVSTSISIQNNNTACLNGAIMMM